MATPLEKLILSELECPSCFNHMWPPINQCVKGHSVCHDCFAKISLCPICRGDKSTLARNYALEAIFGKLKVPCQNQHLGCKHESLGELIKDHRNYCWYAKQRCPFMQYDNCEWKDSMINLKSHLTSKHSSNFYQKEKQKFISQNFRKIVNYHYIFVVMYVYGKYFRLTWEIDETTGMTRWAVYLMGSPEEAQKFYYKLEINKGPESKESTIPLTFKSVCDAKPDKETNKFGDHNCFYVHKTLLNTYCIDNGDLHYRVSLYPVVKILEVEYHKDDSPAVSPQDRCLEEDEETEYASDLALLFMEIN